MKLRLLTLIAAFLMAGLAYAVPQSAGEPTAAGMWAQVYPDGRVGGWFLIFENNGVYEGAIAKMFLKPGDDPNPICTHCTGDQKNQPSLGLVIIKGMQRQRLGLREWKHPRSARRQRLSGETDAEPGRPAAYCARLSRD